MLFKMNKYKPSGVYVTGIDLSSQDSDRSVTVLGLVGNSQTGPKLNIINLVPETKPIKWWEFWRYHLITQYNHEVKQSKEEFKRIYGTLEIKKEHGKK